MHILATHKDPVRQDSIFAILHTGAKPLFRLRRTAGSIYHFSLFSSWPLLCAEAARADAGRGQPTEQPRRPDNCDSIALISSRICRPILSTAPFGSRSLAAREYKVFFDFREKYSVAAEIEYQSRGSKRSPQILIRRQSFNFSYRPFDCEKRHLARIGSAVNPSPKLSDRTANNARGLF